MSAIMRAVFGLVAGHEFFMVAFFAACTISPDLSMSGQPCGTLACETNGAHLETPLTVSGADISQLTLQVCRNEVCVRTQPAQTTANQFICDTDGPLSTSCKITSSGNSVELVLDFTGPGSDFVDGDHYVVQVETAGMVSIFALDKTVTYSESRPNGPACDPLCRFVNL